MNRPAARSRERAGTGTSFAANSMAVFAILGLPILVELVIAMVLAALLKRYVFSRDDLIEMVISRIKELGASTADITRKITAEVVSLVRA